MKINDQLENEAPQITSDSGQSNPQPQNKGWDYYANAMNGMTQDAYSWYEKNSHSPQTMQKFANPVGNIIVQYLTDTKDPEVKALLNSNNLLPALRKIQEQTGGIGQGLSPETSASQPESPNAGFSQTLGASTRMGMQDVASKIPYGKEILNSPIYDYGAPIVSGTLGAALGGPAGGYAGVMLPNMMKTGQMPTAGDAITTAGLMFVPGAAGKFAKSLLPETSGALTRIGTDVGTRTLTGGTIAGMQNSSAANIGINAFLSGISGVPYSAETYAKATAVPLTDAQVQTYRDAAGLTPTDKVPWLAMFALNPQNESWVKQTIAKPEVKAALQSDLDTLISQLSNKVTGSPTPEAGSAKQGEFITNLRGNIDRVQKLIGLPSTNAASIQATTASIGANKEYQTNLDALQDNVSQKEQAIQNTSDKIQNLGRLIEGTGLEKRTAELDAQESIAKRKMDTMQDQAQSEMEAEHAQNQLDNFTQSAELSNIQGRAINLQQEGVQRDAMDQAQGQVEGATEDLNQTQDKIRQNQNQQTQLGIDQAKQEIGAQGNQNNLIENAPDIVQQVHEGLKNQASSLTKANTNIKKSFDAEFANELVETPIRDVSPFSDRIDNLKDDIMRISNDAKISPAPKLLGLLARIQTALTQTDPGWDHITNEPTKGNYPVLDDVIQARTALNDFKNQAFKAGINKNNMSAFNGLSEGINGLHELISKNASPKLNAAWQQVLADWKARLQQRDIVHKTLNGFTPGINDDAVLKNWLNQMRNDGQHPNPFLGQELQKQGISPTLPDPINAQKQALALRQESANLANEKAMKQQALLEAQGQVSQAQQMAPDTYENRVLQNQNDRTQFGLQQGLNQAISKAKQFPTIDAGRVGLNTLPFDQRKLAIEKMQMELHNLRDSQSMELRQAQEARDSHIQLNKDNIPAWAQMADTSGGANPNDILIRKNIIENSNIPQEQKDLALKALGLQGMKSEAITLTHIGENGIAKTWKAPNPEQIQAMKDNGIDPQKLIGDMTAKNPNLDQTQRMVDAIKVFGQLKTAPEFLDKIISDKGFDLSGHIKNLEALGINADEVKSMGRLGLFSSSLNDKNVPQSIVDNWNELDPKNQDILLNGKGKAMDMFIQKYVKPIADIIGPESNINPITEAKKHAVSAVTLPRIPDKLLTGLGAPSGAKNTLMAGTSAFLYDFLSGLPSKYAELLATGDMKNSSAVAKQMEGMVTFFQGGANQPKLKNITDNKIIP